MKNTIHNIIFDIGNVLLKWEPAQVIAEKFPAELNLKLKAAEQVIHDHWHDLDRGALSRDDAIALFADLAKIPVDLMREVYFTLRESLELDKNTYQILIDLQRKGYELYCISNMSLDFWDYLTKRYSFWTAFKDILISAEVKMIKPGAEIFIHALARFDIFPEQSVLIDDSPPNVASATALNLSGIVFKSAEQCRAELEQIIGESLTDKNGVN